MKLTLKLGVLMVFTILALCAIPATSISIECSDCATLQSPTPDCKAECNRDLKEATGICQALFDSTGSAHYHNTKWLQECLTTAKNNYDNCLSLCK